MNKKLLVLIFLILLQPLRAQPFKMLRANLIAGLIPDIEDGYGVAFRDFNGDGYPDIYLVCFRNLNRLLINNGGIIPFIDRTIYSGLGGDLMSRGKTNLELGCGAADFDNDGNADIFLAGWGKTSKLFRNTGLVSFEDATTRLNMHGITDANYGLWLDADNDGDIDLYITDEHRSNRLFLNDGNGFFREAIWTEALIDTAVSQGSCAADFDNDGDTDIYVANWFAPDYLLLNNGNALFTPATLPLPTLEQNFSSNSATAADLDNDGDMDLLVVTHEGRVFYYKNESHNGRITFSHFKEPPFNLLEDSVYGALVEDFNNDGLLDCFFSVKGENRLYLGMGNGLFDAAYDTDERIAYSTGSAAADLDQDGDLDIFVANKDEICQVYLNPTNNHNSVYINPIGTKSNRDALGTKIYFYAGADTGGAFLGMRYVQTQCSYLSSSEPLVHFGLGENKNVSAKIVFPSGKTHIRNNLTAGTRLTVYEYTLLWRWAYLAIRNITSYLRTVSFWVNLGLILLLLVLYYLFLQAGVKRYQLQSAALAGRLFVLFIISVAAFLFLRAYPLTVILSVLNIVNLTGIGLLALYAEYMNNQRKKRNRFRRELQALSRDMINIHENEALFKRLLATLSQHEEIERVVLLQPKNKTHLTLSFSLPENASLPPEYPLPAEMQRALLQGERFLSVRSGPLSSLFAVFNVNVLLPVRHEDHLFAVIGLFMRNAASPLNQEDLNLITTIANQTAIAVQNNNYTAQRAELVKKLTEAQLREEYTRQLEETNRQLDQKNSELTRLFKELQEKESQLIHSEKMASLGQLVAGISHELNNPISFIYANSKALTDYLDELSDLLTPLESDRTKKTIAEQFHKILDDIRSIVRDNITGSQNVKELVLNLKNFSRLDQADWKEARLCPGIESSLKILKPQIPDSVNIVTVFNADPLIYCNPGQLNQVFINLISNAVQAIDGSGTVTITTYIKNPYFVVEVRDTGVGLSKENLKRIFDPFFTTKEVNKGTGLGLSISYAIVQKHNGLIEVESEVGKGSVFRVKLPMNKADIKQG